MRLEGEAERGGWNGRLEGEAGRGKLERGSNWKRETVKGNAGRGRLESWGVGDIKYVIGQGRL